MSIEQRLAALEKMGTAELRREWERLNGAPPRSYNRQWLYKRLCWMVQAAEYGGLSAEAERRIQELVPQALAWMPIGRRAFPSGDDPVSPVKRTRLAPGTTLTRRYKDRTIVVTVRESGFEFDGAIYPSLTAVAEKVTNAHWSGAHFFGLRKRKSA